MDRASGGLDMLQRNRNKIPNLLRTMHLKNSAKDGKILPNMYLFAFHPPAQIVKLESFSMVTFIVHSYHVLPGDPFSTAPFNAIAQLFGL